MCSYTLLPSVFICALDGSDTLASRDWPHLTANFRLQWSLGAWYQVYVPSLVLASFLGLHDLASFRGFNMIKAGNNAMGYPRVSLGNEAMAYPRVSLGTRACSHGREARAWSALWCSEYASNKIFECVCLRGVEEGGHGGIDHWLWLHTFALKWFV